MSGCLSPIDIKINTEVNDCTNKCNLTYNYSIAEPIVNMTNNNTYLSYIFTTPTDNIAKLDDEIFNLYELQIYSPSVHQYNSSNQTAELLMIHSNANNSSYELIISIPISQTGAAISDVGFNNLLSISKTNIPTESSGTRNFLIPSLNGLTKKFISEIAKFPYLFSLEEHSAVGGLGSAILEKLNEFGVEKRLHVLAADQTNLSVIGSQAHLRNIKGISRGKIESRVLELIQPA